MIIVAITNPNVHTTSANISCGSPSIDTRGTEIEQKVIKNKQQIIKLISIQLSVSVAIHDSHRSQMRTY